MFLDFSVEIHISIWTLGEWPHNQGSGFKLLRWISTTASFFPLPSLAQGVDPQPHQSEIAFPTSFHVVLHWLPLFFTQLLFFSWFLKISSKWSLYSPFGPLEPSARSNQTDWFFLKGIHVSVYSEAFLPLRLDLYFAYHFKTLITSPYNLLSASGNVNNTINIQNSHTDSSVRSICSARTLSTSACWLAFPALL